MQAHPVSARGGIFQSSVNQFVKLDKENIFNLKGLPSYSVEFIESEDGEINEMILHQQNGDFVVKRKQPSN